MNMQVMRFEIYVKVLKIQELGQVDQNNLFDICSISRTNMVS